MKIKNKFNLFLLPLLAIIFTVSAFTTIKKNDCEDAKDYAQDAYDYFKKSYRSDNLDDAQYYAKKGMNESSDAEDAASNSSCDCDDAESSAGDAYSYGKKSYNADNINDAQYYAKKAMNSTEDITSNAEDCEDQ